MSQALCFQSVEFDVIQQNQQPWVRGYQIGSALGYTAPDVQISKLYTRHADEFTPAMTAVVTLPTEGGPQETRIFSLRGCHLLAMFARTPVAKAFRKWCLDVIERYGDRVPVERPISLTPSTPDDRKPLRDMVNVWARLSGVHPSNLWPQVRARFQLGRIDDLPTNWLPDALAWVQGKIDELNQKPKAAPPYPNRHGRNKQPPRWNASGPSNGSSSRSAQNWNIACAMPTGCPATPCRTI